jgi:hypothetical protein
MNKRIALLAAAAVGLVAWMASSVRVSAGDTNQDKRIVTSLGGLESRAPEEWKRAETSRPNRVYQFSVPKAEGDSADAEIAIFYFGPNGAGSAAENVTRWKGMFIPPEGKTIDDAAKVAHFKTAGEDTTYADIQGTYKFKARPFDPNAKEELKPDHRMLGVIFGSPKGPYYIRFVGPAKTVSQHKVAFDDWLKSFK